MISLSEIFKIEPVQKYSVFTFLCVNFVTFLQINLFASHLMDDYFVCIGLCLGFSVCWLVLNIPSILFLSEIGKQNQKKIMLDRVTLIYSFSVIFWMMLVTYIAYEANLELNKFIRFTLILILIKTSFWFFMSLGSEILDKKSQKKEETESKD